MLAPFLAHRRANALLVQDMGNTFPAKPFHVMQPEDFPNGIGLVGIPRHEQRLLVLLLSIMRSAAPANSAVGIDDGVRSRIKFFLTAIPDVADDMGWFSIGGSVKPPASKGRARARNNSP